MARPRQYPEPRSATGVRLAPELLAALHAAADERDVSVNWIITRAVERFLADLLPVDEFRLTRTDLARTERAESSPDPSGQVSVTGGQSGR